MRPSTGPAPRRSLAARIARRLPPVLLEQPWGIFVMSLCIVSGLTTFAGPRPGSIESSLPSFIVTIWSFILVAGSISALAGLLHPALRRLEILGLIWLGTASIVYAVTIGLRFGWSGVVAAGIVFGFGGAALTRALAVYVSFEIAKRVARDTS